MARYYTTVLIGARKRRVYVMADSVNDAIRQYNDKGLYTSYDRIHEA